MQKQIVATLIRASEPGLRYVSGGDMARELGITRAAIWKYMESIREDGGIVQAVPGRGYRLANPEDVLLAGAVQTDTSIVGREYVFLPEVDSTNSEAKRRIRAGCLDGLVVVAEHQTAGRGRMGRIWHSVPGKSLCMSVALFPEDLPISQAPLLTPLTAVAVYRAIVKVTGLPVELKWPNDLLIGGRKLGGILLEASGETDRLRYAIIGIGINVNSSQEDIPTALADIATSLGIAGNKPVARRHLLQEVLVCLDTYYGNYLKFGPGPIIAKYRELCSTLGQRIRFAWQARTWSGLATEINPDGGLVVRTDSNDTLILRSGDVHCL
ncbi:MAG: biotin--[acetyl-CoA-carboxylase] ligase [Firmicutes bacterium]|nr:biotin--[acetyl-CoA-carboxylase] ligase [Bacillota bacterium]